MRETTRWGRASRGSRGALRDLYVRHGTKVPRGGLVRRGWRYNGSIISDRAEVALCWSTPGLESVFQKHEDITRRFLHRSDTVLLVMLATQAMSAHNVEYLKILKLAAEEGETTVDEALRELLEGRTESTITVEAIDELVQRPETITPVTVVEVATVDLSTYDQLCTAMAVRQ